jgi:type II secretion system protein C
MVNRSKSTKRTCFFPDEVKAKILATAREYPELGVQRLSSRLKMEGFVVSRHVIRSTLLKQGLHTRELRFERLQGRQQSEREQFSAHQRQSLEKFNRCPRKEKFLPTPPPGLPDSAGDKVTPPEPIAPDKKSGRITSSAALKSPSPTTTRPGVSHAEVKKKTRRIARSAATSRTMRQWPVFMIMQPRFTLNVALTCVAIYFGWSIVSSFMEFQIPVTDHTPSAALRAENDEAQKLTSTPEDYRVVTERELFEASRVSREAQDREAAPITQIATIVEGVGLRLIGTVVASAPMESYAVISLDTTGEQAIYFVNQRVGNAILRQILRSNVFIETEDGQVRRLAFGTASATVLADEAEEDIVAIPTQPNQIVESLDPVSVRRDAVAPLKNAQHVVEEVRMFKITAGGGTDGLRLGNLAYGHPLSQIGLFTGDVVRVVNGEEIGNPADAEMFLLSLANGGDLSIILERKGQLKMLNVKIE